MKVLCTNSDWESENLWTRLKEHLYGRHKPDPMNGYIYTVEKQKGAYYHLKEFPYEKEGYRIEYFIPVDEISYTATKKEKILEPSLN